MKYQHLNPVMDERMRRLWAGAEALAYGPGGLSAVAAATGLSRTAVALEREDFHGEWNYTILPRPADSLVLSVEKVWSDQLIYDRPLRE